MEKYFKDSSACHQEISVKYTNEGINTRRCNFGFETIKMHSVSDFLLDKLGPAKYNKVVKHFKREIQEPRAEEYMMLGFDGQDYEIYVEYNLGGKSYDLRRDTLFIYNPYRPDKYSEVYSYLRETLPEDIYDMLSRVLPPHKCDTLYAKESPFHRCVYLFRPSIFPQVKFIKELLYKAAKVVNRGHVPLEDSMYLSYIGIGITLDSRPELAYYFRRSRQGQEIRQPEPRSSEARAQR